jgi:hypothetical protein
VTDPLWLSTFRINERKVSDYRRGRVFLAGDAAHIHSPAGGQGMNTGMQDAINLAWKLAMVTQRRATTTLLDSYSPERNAVGEMVLRNAGRLTDVATLAHPAAQAARNLALRFLLGLHAVQDRIAMTLSEIDIAYANSPLSRGRKAGVRLAPQHYDGPPPGTGTAPRFVLFAADTEKGAALAARFPAVLEPEPRTPPGRQGLLIVRPHMRAGLVKLFHGVTLQSRNLMAWHQYCPRQSSHSRRAFPANLTSGGTASPPLSRIRDGRAPGGRHHSV